GRSCDRKAPGSLDSQGYGHVLEPAARALDLDSLDGVKVDIGGLNRLNPHERLYDGRLSLAARIFAGSPSSQTPVRRDQGLNRFISWRFISLAASSPAFVLTSIFASWFASLV